MSFVGVPKCVVCNKIAHPVESEQDTEQGVWYHRSCLRCAICNAQLSVKLHEKLAEFIYCREHYCQLLKEIKEEKRRAEAIEAGEMEEEPVDKRVFPNSKPPMTKSKSGSLIMLEGRNALPQLKNKFQPAGGESPVSSPQSPGSRLRTRAASSNAVTSHLSTSSPNLKLSAERNAPSSPTKESEGKGVDALLKAGEVHQQQQALAARVKELEAEVEKAKKDAAAKMVEAQLVLSDEKKLWDSEKELLTVEKSKIEAKLAEAQEQGEKGRSAWKEERKELEKKLAAMLREHEEKNASVTQEREKERRDWQKEKGDIAKLLKENQKKVEELEREKKQLVERQKEEDPVQAKKQEQADAHAQLEREREALAGKQAELKKEQEQFEGEMERLWLQIDDEKRKLASEAAAHAQLRSEIEAEKQQLAAERQQLANEAAAHKKSVEAETAKIEEDKQVIHKSKSKSQRKRAALKSQGEELAEAQKLFQTERVKFDEQMEIQLNVIEEEKQALEAGQEKAKRRKLRLKEQQAAAAVASAATAKNTIQKKNKNSNTNSTATNASTTKDSIPTIAKNSTGSASLDDMEDELEALLKEVKQHELESQKYENPTGSSEDDSSDSDSSDDNDDSSDDDHSASSEGSQEGSLRSNGGGNKQKNGANNRKNRASSGSGDGGIGWLCQRLPSDQGDRLRALKERLLAEKKKTQTATEEGERQRS